MFHSLLLAGLSRLLRPIAASPATPPSPPSQSPPRPPPGTKPQPASYEAFLTTALSPSHPLHIRHKLPQSILTNLLTSQTQLVNLSPGPILPQTHVPVYTIDDLTRPPPVANPITAALNGCVWDSRLVQTGFDWTLPSVWFIPLDVSLLSYDLLDRHFRMVATLSTPDSRCVLLYPARQVNISGFVLEAPFDDIEAFMKLCGFAVDSINTFAELTEERIPQYHDYINIMHVAVVRPAPRLPSPVVDTISEVTCASNDHLSQAASTEFEEYLSSDRRVVRFELDISTLPSHLAVLENHVVVIGSDSCIGCWDPRHAKRMTGRIDIPGTLVADVAISVFATDVEYKYAVIRGHHVVEWESGWNRCFSDHRGILRDEWRCA